MPEKSNQKNKDKPLIDLQLTVKQLVLLDEILMSFNDCGPSDNGWASQELRDLRILVEDNIIIHI